MPGFPPRQWGYSFYHGGLWVDCMAHINSRPSADIHNIIPTHIRPNPAHIGYGVPNHCQIYRIVQRITAGLQQNLLYICTIVVKKTLDTGRVIISTRVSPIHKTSIFHALLTLVLYWLLQVFSNISRIFSRQKEQTIRSDAQIRFLKKNVLQSFQNSNVGSARNCR